MGAFGDFMMGTEGTPERYEWLENRQYDWTEDAYNQIAQNALAQQDRVNQGQFSEWYGALRPQLRQGLDQGLQNTYFGAPGERQGTIQAAQQVGAQTGVGPKATHAQVNKQLYNYGQQSSAIDQYLAQLDYQTQQQDVDRYFNQIQSLPQGPQGQFGHFAGTPGTTGFLQESAGKLVDAGLAYATGGASMFGGGGGSPMQASSQRAISPTQTSVGGGGGFSAPSYQAPQTNFPSFR